MPARVCRLPFADRGVFNEYFTEEPGLLVPKFKGTLSDVKRGALWSERSDKDAHI